MFRNFTQKCSSAIARCFTRQGIEDHYFNFLALATIILNIIIFAVWNGRALGIEPKYQEYKVIFTDPLYEDWTDQYSQYGSTALFDLQPAVDIIIDICGPTSGNIFGRAYDQHHGWDRNIPNDKNKYTVFAIAPGVIEKTKSDCIEGDKPCNDFAGNYVRIRHNAKVVTKVFHLATNKVFVKEGQFVDRFTPLGYGGNTGYSFGDHVHVQIEVDGVAVDPLSLSLDWFPQLVINKKKCAQDPQHNLITWQSLRDYALAQIADFDTTFMNQGYEVKQGDSLHWLINSGGGDTKDILIQTYTKENAKSSIPADITTDKTAIFFDLSGNASSPIVLDEPVLKWWYEHQTVYSAGKPLFAITDAASLTTKTFFTNKIVTQKASIGITKEEFYPENTCPGMFNDGWHGSQSYAVIASYKKNGGPEKVGYPTGKDSKTAAVHAWTGTGYFLQDFGGGSYGSCGIMLQASSDNFKAFLIRGAMWDTYRGVGNGPAKFGYPLSDRYFDSEFEQDRQDFEKGLSILASGDIIATTGKCPGIDATSTGTKCNCPGNTKTLPCGNCGIQKWTCKANLWVATGQCENQGTCAPGATQEQSCGGQCKGTEIRTCTASCTWGVWSACSKIPLNEICDYMDNDCDGQTDEGVKNLCGGCASLTGKPAEACGPCGIYVCENEDTLTCKSTAICKKGDMKKVPCACSGDVKALECDGCAWKEILPCSKKPTAEICDSVDNDCDGTTDEDNVCCSKNKEICNGKDDNCDGQTDEGVKNACGGCVQFKVQVDAQCGPCAVWKCDGKDNVACTNKPNCCIPSQEICDSVDNDCDGEVDEGVKNACGGCSALKYKLYEACSLCGEWQCDGKDNMICLDKPNCCIPSQEICNGKDDNCNGQIDEGVKNNCGGCTQLNHQPYEACGPCGVWMCEGKDTINCIVKIGCIESQPPPPSPPPTPPPSSKNACGGDSSLGNQPGTSCGNCGTWQCSGQNSVSCSSSGTCIPGTTSSMSCQLTQSGSLCPAKGGTQTITCGQNCQWQYGSCSGNFSTQPYFAFETQKVCGSKYCFQITSASGSTGYGKMTKPSGTAFGNGPIEWYVRNFTTGKSIGQSIGFGCDNYYTGQYAGNIQFNLDTIQGKSSIGLQTHSNFGCNELDITPGLAIEKCQ